jgi:hypothetical protein
MDKQPDNNAKQMSQTKLWSDAELRRVTRVFDLLIRVDKRLKEGKGNEKAKNQQGIKH